MSAIHRTPQWVTLSKVERPRWQARIDAGGVRCFGPCVMGGIVWPGQKWDLSHTIDASTRPDLAYVAALLQPSHQRCNRKAGSALANRNRATKKQGRQQPLPNPRPEWNKRPW